MKTVTMRVNGIEVSKKIQENMTLVDFLRKRLLLTGSKKGCGIGECGACTVQMNGVTVNACLVLALQAEGADIVTIEGLADGDTLHPLQTAFIEKGGVQCGYCTPGMIMSAKDMLDAKQKPTREEVKRALSGNLCRCTGYTKIISSVESAAEVMNDEQGR